MNGKPWRPSMPRKGREEMDAAEAEVAEMNEELAAALPANVSEMMRKSLFYDRQGKPISQADWSEAQEDFDYKMIGKTIVRGLEISTVWNGLDTSLLAGPPMIFETFVFRLEPREREPLGVAERYATEDQARQGHERWSEATRAMVKAGVEVDSIRALRANLTIP